MPILCRPVSDFVAHLENATLPREEWTHSAHLAVALAVYRTDDGDDLGKEERTLIKLRKLILNYNTATGVFNGPMSGYHETMTVFFLCAVISFANQNKGEAEALLPQLIEKWGDKNCVFTYYSRRYLFSPGARFHFSEPDLRSFDF